MKPVMTMFYTIKAVNLHCNNGDCIFCEYHDFCQQVVGSVQYLRLHFPEDYKQLYSMIKEGGKNENNLYQKGFDAGYTQAINDNEYWDDDLGYKGE